VLLGGKIVRFPRWFTPLLLGICWLLLQPVPIRANEFGSSSPPSNSLFTPQRHQFDLSLSDSLEFVDPGSLARRDNFRKVRFAGPFVPQPGSALHLSSDLGLSTLNLPSLRSTFWFNETDALQFQARYYVNYGAAGLHQKVFFNADIISPNQLLSTGGTRWFAFDLLYQRRLTPLYQRYDDNLPAILRGWDVRGGIGLEFVYLDFRIRDGHPHTLNGVGKPFRVTAPLLTRSRFHERELPLPTVALEARRHIGGPVYLEITAQGNWANKWDSFRSDGGHTAYLSQAAFETHWRLVYSSGELPLGIRPFVGANYLYYKQVVHSGLVNDFIRAQMYGPEFGLTMSF
jgi:hypothetical protein